MLPHWDAYYHGLAYEHEARGPEGRGHPHARPVSMGVFTLWTIGLAAASTMLAAFAYLVN
jgi:hypothetical protein